MWEVVFYDDHKETIARINKAGEVEELRINLTFSELPEKIFQSIKSKGEIMNVITINKSNDISWEIIYRNQNLVRFLIILDPDGKELSSRQL